MIAQHVQDCIDACQACALACDQCADACLGEEHVHHMVACIRLDRDCAKVCQMAVSFMASNSAHAADVCKLCAHICEACAAECGQHDEDHCRACAEACRRCAEACRQMALSAHNLN
ncbi:four-helix bundle copper-binding protein [Rudanella paleaurantiibacter]|uniref:Four-helix bundle copper-binding protein n=1 Tax=Rudanella paleaurantiibacter TaxID=2614655 RepID=A0A7J5U3U7_9BACT|nr:four-helix bundle copper-binding protein [Rudanella paleaurantiibacter]KAB7732519.1 four-helix bundle copper-binding protein [Rudanella paleaurantiibacter]